MIFVFTCNLEYICKKFAEETKWDSETKNWEMASLEKKNLQVEMSVQYVF